LLVLIVWWDVGFGCILGVCFGLVLLVICGGLCFLWFMDWGFGFRFFLFAGWLGWVLVQVVALIVCVGCGCCFWLDVVVVFWLLVVCGVIV